MVHLANVMWWHPHGFFRQLNVEDFTDLFEHVKLRENNSRHDGLLGVTIVSEMKSGH